MGGDRRLVLGAGPQSEGRRGVFSPDLCLRDLNLVNPSDAIEMCPSFGGGRCSSTSQCTLRNVDSPRGYCQRIQANDGEGTAVKTELNYL